MLGTVLFSFFSLAASLSCRDENGHSVDSWVSIKEPQGTQYLYYNANTPLELSSHSLNDTTVGALAYTTEQIWTSDVDTYAMYNDEPPLSENYSFTYGHTKGYFALATDSTGFFITHSVPAFPQGPQAVKKYNGLLGNAFTYAQNLLCLSLNASTLDALTYKFLLNRPELYDSQLGSLGKTYGNLTALLTGKYSAAAVCVNQLLQTVGGTSFLQFAKSTQWNNELYSACVAPRLQTTLWVESWIRGSAEPPSCPTSGYDTLDIQGLNFSGLGAWTETNDHSKWAIGQNGSWVCMGDINRMTTQYARGGGTTCWQDKVLYKTLTTAVTGTDSC